MTRPACGWTLLAAALWIAGGPATGTARADDVQVNTYTTNAQLRPSVALDADGDFVIVWDSVGSPGSDTSAESVQGQRYASDGSTVGGQFQVNTYTTSSQDNASVSLDDDGDFVVVWESIGSVGNDPGSSIQGQRYASDGSAVGGQFQVNTYTTDLQEKPLVSLDADGDFVVVWASFGSAGTDSSDYSVQGQRYASDGSPVGSQFQVNTFTADYQYQPAVALDAAGDFVVVWASFGSAGTDSSGYSVQGQRYASDGSAVGGEFQVNTHTPSSQDHPAVALDADGDFVVVWSSFGSAGTDSSNFSVQGQRYASDGSAVGGEFQVNTYTTNFQITTFAGVAVDADGDFVVAWYSNGSGTDSSGYSVHIQRYASDGSTVGGEFQANAYTTGNQLAPAVSMDAGGDFVVAWHSDGSAGTDSSTYSIQKTAPGFVPVELLSFTVE
jgi:hypothetical protein